MYIFINDLTVQLLYNYVNPSVVSTQTIEGVRYAVIENRYLNDKLVKVFKSFQLFNHGAKNP